MVQELIDLRQSIVDGRYQDTLDIVDEIDLLLVELPGGKECIS